MSDRLRADCFDGDSKRFCTEASLSHPQSNVGSGDSGGPVFVREAGLYLVLGGNSTSAEFDGDDASHSTTVEFVPWIREVAKNAGLALPGPPADDPPADDPPVDECSQGIADCGENATCTDVAVGFECQCKSGFRADGAACVDVDECAQGAGPCRADQICQNTAGSHVCGCPAGQSEPGLGVGCQVTVGDNPPADEGRPPVTTVAPAAAGGCGFSRANAPCPTPGAALLLAALSVLSRVRRRSRPATSLGCRP